MNWNKLLEKQIGEYLPLGALPDELLKPFLQAVNETYNDLQNRIEVVERTLSDALRVQKEELDLKEYTVKEIGKMARALEENGTQFAGNSLSEFIEFLKAQVWKRKEAELSLSTTANRLSSLITNMQMGILVEDENRRIVRTNNYFCNIFGIPVNPEMLIGADCSQSAEQSKMLFRDPEGFVKRITEILEERKLVVNEELAFCDGRYFERDYIPIFIDNEYKGHLWNYRDITERKLAEVKLKKGEELWQFALEGAGEGVWEYNFQEKTAFFSKQYKKMLGFEDSEFANDPREWFARVHPDDMHIIREGEEAYYHNKINAHHREYRLLHKNGHYIWVLDRGMVVSRTPDGKPLRIIGTQTDITEGKASEQAIKLKEEKYRNIIANMNLGLLEVDNDELIQYANQSFCQMSCYTLDELLGKKPAELFTIGKESARVEQKNELRKHGVSDAYELEVRNKKGEMKWWLISGAPRYNDSGEMVGSIGIHLDITKQKKLELDLNVARESAEQSAKAKETFLANMSHEIRTPMNAILGMSRQLEKSVLNEEQRFFLKTISTATDNLMVVINDILDISKIEAGKMTLEYIGFRLEDVVKHATGVMQLRTDEKGLELKIDIDQRIAPILLGDPHRINQVLLNLMSNAIKFTEKGNVSIVCKLAEGNTAQQIINIRIKDTGIGMDDDFLSNLFEKFVQEDRTTARKYGGTGLGMAICKQLIELMGGNIEVYSKKGMGTEVQLTIPFAIGQESDLPDTSKEISNSAILKGTRILLAEDNEMNRLVVSTILKGYGVTLKEVVNGEEAVKELRHSLYDLVLMDVQMPVLNGLEATAAIRNELKLDIPIIALTANAIKGERERCIGAGMNDFVSKPFEESDLVNTIGVCLQKKIPVMDTHKEATIKDTIEQLPAKNEAPLFNLSKLQQIGDDDFIQKMLSLFITETTRSVSEINAAFLQGDFDTIRAAAHKIKPSIDSMDIFALKDVVRKLEFLAGNEPDGKKIASLVITLDHVMKDVNDQLKKLIK